MGIDAFHETLRRRRRAGHHGLRRVRRSRHGGPGRAHWDHKIHVDHPACDDLVLGCGGTKSTAATDVVWNDGTPFDPNTPGGGGWASGGGISEIFAVPSYQPPRTYSSRSIPGSLAVACPTSR